MAIDYNALLDDAKCLDCLQPGQLDQIELYLLRDWAGLSSQEINDSLDAARCFGCLTAYQLRLIRLYALTVINGTTSDPNALLEAAECLKCLLAWQLRIISVAGLYDAINGESIGDSFNELLDASRCLGCLTRYQMLQLSAHFLVVKAGLTTDTNALLALAGCLDCLLGGQMRMIEAYMFFLASSGAGGETFYILFENGDRWLTEDGLNLIRKE